MLSQSSPDQYVDAASDSDHVPTLVFDRVTFRYPGQQAEAPVIDAFTLEVHQRERVALIGPSGSGKSTLLGLATGLIKPSAGSVHRPAHRIAVVQQNTPVFKRRSCLHNVALGAVVRCDWQTALAAALPVLNTLGLGEFADTAAWRLSGGQRQRLCVARALVAEPELLVLDEPTSQLDTATKQHVLDALTIHNTSAMLVATHDQSILQSFDRVIEL